MLLFSPVSILKEVELNILIKLPKNINFIKFRIDKINIMCRAVMIIGSHTESYENNFSVFLVLLSGATPQRSILCIRNCVDSYFHSR